MARAPRANSAGASISAPSRAPGSKLSAREVPLRLPGTCAVLFAQGGKWRHVAPRAELLPQFRLTDSEWEAAGIPVAIAFFYRSSQRGGLVAAYPGPAGSTVVAPPYRRRARDS